MRASTVLSTFAVAALASAQTTGKLGDAPVVLTNPVGSEYIANLPNNPNNPIRGSVVAISAPSGRGVRIAVTLSGLPASGGPFRTYCLHTALLRRRCQS
jgi:hypothetical protein